MDRFVDYTTYLFYVPVPTDTTVVPSGTIPPTTAHSELPPEPSASSETAGEPILRMCIRD